MMLTCRKSAWTAKAMQEAACLLDCMFQEIPQDSDVGMYRLVEYGSILITPDAISSSLSARRRSTLFTVDDHGVAAIHEPA
jgi:hypothetical protein